MNHRACSSSRRRGREEQVKRDSSEPALRENQFAAEWNADSFAWGSFEWLSLACSSSGSAYLILQGRQGPGGAAHNPAALLTNLVKASYTHTHARRSAPQMLINRNNGGKAGAAQRRHAHKRSTRTAHAHTRTITAHTQSQHTLPIHTLKTRRTTAVRIRQLNDHEIASGGKRQREGERGAVWVKGQPARERERARS